MTVLEKNIEFKKVLMVIARKTIHKEICLKEGYTYVPYSSNLFDDWCKLHVETGLFDTIEQAKHKLNEMLEQDQGFFKQNFLFVQDDHGNLVGSAGLWPGRDFQDKRLRLHYVSVSPKAQHNKIAQAMITKLCMMYDNQSSKYPLYLATQSQSYGAIALYAKLGFTPYFGAYNGCSEKENEAAWVFTTEILRQKTMKH